MLVPDTVSSAAGEIAPNKRPKPAQMLSDLDDMLGCPSSRNSDISFHLPCRNRNVYSHNNPSRRSRTQSATNMFARKDLEHDVLSAYQRHRRNLKKATTELNSEDSKQPRTVQIETAEDAGVDEGSGSVKVGALENQAL